MKNTNVIETSALALLLAWFPAYAQTQDPASDAQKPDANTTVEISGKRLTDVDVRRESTVTTLVVSHDEIMKYGDIDLGDVLKRLPGITLGGRGGRSGGEIRMRGLGAGYTQILINGEPAPRGFALDSLSPELIERIEIIRAPLAEHSAQAIAGTINIVLRQVPPKKNKEITFTESLEDNAHPEARLAVQYNDRSDKFSWLLSGTIKQMGQLESADYAHNRIVVPGGSATTQATVLEDQTTTDHQYRNGYNLNIAPRLNWRESEQNNASVQLFAFRRSAVDQFTDTMSDAVGTAQYSTQLGHSQNTSEVYKLTVDRLMPLAGGSFETHVSFSDFVSNADTHYLQATPNGSLGLESNNDNHVSGVNTKGKWSYALNDTNKFVMGYEGDWSSQTNDLLQSGYILNSPPVTTDTSATVLRLAGFAQDEWNLSAHWGWYAGLRWESLTTRGGVDSGDITNRSAVLSPSLQGVWRFGDQLEKNASGGYQDQIRWSLSRAYRAPGTGSLLPRVVLSTMNDAFHPDSEGNPNLRPELSWGMETAFEHYFKSGGNFSVNVFQRQVTDVIRTLTTQQADGRWISQPINLDHATIRGIEIDGKVNLNQFVEHGPSVELHGNVARYWSQVSGIPGPCNYLSGQTPASANVGVDYAPSHSLSMGANVTWVPGVTTQLSDTQQSFTGGKTGIDSYILWKFKPGWQARLAATNLWHPDYITSGLNDYNGDVNTNATVAHTWVNWTASLNAKF